MSTDYTNPNTNPKTITTLALTLTDPHGAFESFCAPELCDFVRNYSCTVDGAVVISYFILKSLLRTVFPSGFRTCGCSLHTSYL